MQLGNGAATSSVMPQGLLSHAHEFGSMRTDVAGVQPWAGPASQRVARIASETTIEAARAELTTLGKRRAGSIHEAREINVRRTIHAIGSRDGMVGVGHDEVSSSPSCGGVQQGR